MFILTQVIEGVKSSGRQCFIAFMDIEKAYDRINRSLMWEICKKVGLNPKIINILKSLYSDTKAKYSLGGIESDWVESKRGVRQGCILSPTLFAMFMEELTQRMKKLDVGLKILTDKISILLFADDIVLIATSEDELQRLLDEVERFASDSETKFSIEKSQVLIVGREINELDRWKFNGETLKITKEYTYLGIKINQSGARAEKKKRIGGAEQWCG